MSPLKSSQTLNFGNFIDLYRSRKLGSEVTVNDADKPWPESNQPYLYIMSRDSGNNYWIHILKTNGTLAGRISTGYSGNTCMINLSVIWPKLIFSKAGNSEIKVADISDLDGGTISAVTYSWSETIQWAPFNGSELVRIMNNTAYIIDIFSGNTRTISFSGSGSSTYAQTMPTVGFADQGSELINTLKDTYVYAGGTGSGSFPITFYAAQGLRTPPTTNTQIDFVNANYSRSGGYMVSATKGITHQGGSQFMLVTENPLSSTQISNNSLTYNSNTYNFYQQDSTSFAPRLATPTKFYSIYQRSISTYDYEFRLGYNTIDPSYNPAPTDAGITFSNQSNTTSGYYSSPQAGIHMDRINENGYIAVSYYDYNSYGFGTTNLMIKILDDSANVVQTIGPIDMGTYAAGNTNINGNYGINGESKFTNVLFKGNRYEPF